MLREYRAHHTALVTSPNPSVPFLPLLGSPHVPLKLRLQLPYPGTVPPCREPTRPRDPAPPYSAAGTNNLVGIHRSLVESQPRATMIDQGTGKLVRGTSIGNGLVRRRCNQRSFSPWTHQGSDCDESLPRVSLGKLDTAQALGLAINAISAVGRKENDVRIALFKVARCFVGEKTGVSEPRGVLAAQGGSEWGDRR